MGDLIEGKFGRKEPVGQPEGHMWNDDENVTRLEPKPTAPELVGDARIEAAVKAVIELDQANAALNASNNNETRGKRGETSVRLSTLMKGMQPQDQHEVYRRAGDMRGEVGHG
jgi:hypothetical protein